MKKALANNKKITFKDIREQIEGAVRYADLVAKSSHSRNKETVKLFEKLSAKVEDNQQYNERLFKQNLEVQNKIEKEANYWRNKFQKDLEHIEKAIDAILNHWGLKFVKRGIVDPSYIPPNPPVVEVFELKEKKEDDNDRRT